MQTSLEYSDFIIFQIGSENLCLDLTIVQEVIEIEHIKPFPLATKRFQGIINLRGEIIPIIHNIPQI